jgi:hypothetical protein
MVQKNSNHTTGKDDTRTKATSASGRGEATRNFSVSDCQLRGPKAHATRPSAPALRACDSFSLLYSHLALQSAASKAGRSFSAPPPAAPAAAGPPPLNAPPPSHTAMAHAHCHAISRAGSEVSPMMRLAFKSATPMRDALSAASPQLSIADNHEEDEAGSAEAMHQVGSGCVCSSLFAATRVTRACSWNNSCSSSRLQLWYPPPPPPPPPPELLFFISQSTPIHQCASEGGHSPAAVPDESPEEQRDFASLLEQVSALTVQPPPPSAPSTSSQRPLTFPPPANLIRLHSSETNPHNPKSQRPSSPSLQRMSPPPSSRASPCAGAPPSLVMLVRYLNTVEELRSQALALWETVRQQGVFPASVLAGLQRCNGLC